MSVLRLPGIGLCLRTCLSYSSLCCLCKDNTGCLDKSVLQPELPLDVSVLQQPMLPLDISVLKQPVLPGRVFSTAAYAASGRICSKAACAASKRVCPTAPWAASTCVCSSVPQHTVLNLNVFVLASLFCLSSCLLSCCMAAFAVLGLVWSTAVCTWAHLCLCLYCPRRCLSCSSLCFTWTYLYMSPVYAIPGGTQFTNFFCLFWFFSKQFFYCFGCFDTCSKHRNKPKNSFFGFTKQTEKQPKEIVFRFFSVQTENIFCFEDTLALVDPA